jgi:hypothetical protein
MVVMTLARREATASPFNQIVKSEKTTSGTADIDDAKFQSGTDENNTQVHMMDEENDEPVKRAHRRYAD